MSEWRRDVHERVATLNLPSDLAARFADELTAHLDDRYADLVASGVTGDDASRLTRRELLSPDALEQACRAWLAQERRTARRSGLVDWMTDAREAWRSVRRRPRHAAAIALTLGIGMAATTTLYAVVDAVVIRPLPYRDADRLIVAGLSPGGADHETGRRQALYGVSAADVFDWRDRATAFDRLAPVEQRSVFHNWGDGPELIDTAVVGEGFLDLIDAAVVAGRPFGAADFSAGGDDVALVSHTAWINRYGGSADIVGRQVGGMTIVGVLAPIDVPEAVLSRPPQFWRPMRPSDERYGDRRRRSGLAIGRLRRGVSLDVARTDLDDAHADIAALHPDAHTNVEGGRTHAGVNFLHDQTVGEAGRPVLVFFGAAVLLLALATVNAGNLSLLRTLDRRREFSMRRALGAGSSRILRVLLVEHVFIAIAASALGAAAAYGGVALFAAYGPDSVPRFETIAVNARVLVASAVGSIGVGLLVGLMPALRAVSVARVSPSGLEASYGATGGGARLRVALVGVQVALATLLVVAAGLLVSSYVRVDAGDLGFEADQLATFTLPVKVGDYQSSADVWDEILAAVRQVPGVSHVAGTTDRPLTVSGWKPGVGLDGEPPAPILGGYAGFIVTPSYFETIGARLISGRGFSAADTATSEGAVIVNHTFTERFLRGRTAVGVPIAVAAGFGELQGRIIGVVADVVEDRVQPAARPAVYLVHTQMRWMIGPTVMVRSSSPAESLLPSLRRAAATYDARLPVLGLGLMRDRVSDAVVDPRFRAALFAAFAAVSLVMAGVGLYGSLAHSVGRRTRELGIRMALGADERQVAGLVVRQGAVAAGLGLAAGLGAAAALGRFLESFLYGVTAREPAIFAATAVVLLSVTAVAALAPARRATRTDVLASLRMEG